MYLCKYNRATVFSRIRVLSVKAVSVLLCKPCVCVSSWRFCSSWRGALFLEWRRCLLSSSPNLLCTSGLVPTNKIILHCRLIASLLPSLLPVLLSLIPLLLHRPLISSPVPSSALRPSVSHSPTPPLSPPSSPPRTRSRPRPSPAAPTPVTRCLSAWIPVSARIATY